MRGVNLEDSWKGEILPGFLFLGDRVTASDMDRLTTLEVTHILNATEDVSNFFEGTSHLKYMRCPIKDRSEAASDIATHFDACVDFINSARESNGPRSPSLHPPCPSQPQTPNPKPQNERKPKNKRKPKPKPKPTRPLRGRPRPRALPGGGVALRYCGHRIPHDSGEPACPPGWHSAPLAQWRNDARSPDRRSHSPPRLSPASAPPQPRLSPAAWARLSPLAPASPPPAPPPPPPLRSASGT